MTTPPDSEMVAESNRLWSLLLDVAEEGCGEDAVQNLARALAAAYERGKREERERPCSWCMNTCPNCGARPDDPARQPEEGGSDE